MSRDPVVPRAQTLRANTARLADEMTAAAGRYKLPPPLPSLDEARRRMEENVYRVLVLGEAKRGKSTFINALMGDSLLPADVSIATSKVFQVRWAQQTAYRLRFEDGSTREIARQELEIYGREHGNPASPLPGLSQILRWIEVEGPFPFIPPNVRVLDTPGLGSLYAEHGRIIQRFVPMSEAVVFVLSSEQPVTELELDAIAGVLRYTRLIFFVQTQIDQYSEDDWVAVLERNREILNKRFGGKIGSVRETIQVWPVSGKQLLQVALTERETYRERFYRDSRFVPMERGLRRFLFQLTGCTRIAVTLEQLRLFHQEGQKQLQEQVRTAQVVGQESRAQAVREKQERLERFVAEWSASGGRRLEMERRVRDAMRDVRAQFISFFDYPTGFLYRYYEKQVDGIRSVQEAQELARLIEQEAAEKGNLHWLRCARAYRFKLVEILAPVFGEPDSWDISSFQPVPNVRTQLQLEREPLEVRDTPMARAKVAWGGAAMLLGLGGALAAALPIAGFAVAGAYGALAFGVWEMHQAGNRLTEQSARPQLRNYLRYVLDTVRAQYITPRLNEPCLIDTYFRRVEDEVLQRVGELYEQRRSTYTQSLRELETLKRSNEASLQELRTGLESARAAWDSFAPRLTALQTEVRTLYEMPLPDPVQAGGEEPLTPEQLNHAKARYRQLLLRVLEDDTITPEEEQQLDELADLLSLPRRLTRQLRREATTGS